MSAGGLSGSTAAAMLGRTGNSTALIDPHESYPADFRVEKLSDHLQAERFPRTGIAESGTARRGHASGADLPRSLLLLVVLVLIVLEVVVIVAVVIGVRRHAMGLVDLVVPQLTIGAVPREQFGMRAALDRPAP